MFRPGVVVPQGRAAVGLVSAGAVGIGGGSVCKRGDGYVEKPRADDGRFGGIGVDWLRDDESEWNAGGDWRFD